MCRKIAKCHSSSFLSCFPGLTQDCLDLSFQTGYKSTPFTSHTLVLWLFYQNKFNILYYYKTFSAHSVARLIAGSHFVAMCTCSALHTASNHCHTTAPCPWPCRDLDDSAVNISMDDIIVRLHGQEMGPCTEQSMELLDTIRVMQKLMVEAGLVAETDCTNRSKYL